MPYTQDPLNNPVDRIRLSVGDVDDCDILNDNDYKYFLSKYNNNEHEAMIASAYAILAKMAKYRRERTGQIEVYGNQSFQNYMQWLKETIDNPTAYLSNVGQGIFFGGVYKDEYVESLEDDNISDPVFYRGQLSRRAQVLTSRVFTPNGIMEYDEYGRLLGFKDV